MASTLQVVDPENLSTVLFDLNDDAAANSAAYGGVRTQLVGDPDWGVPVQRSTQNDDQLTPTGFVTFAQQALATATIKMILKASSYQAETLAAGVLAQYLSQGCVLKWLPDGAAASELRYIDVEPSETPVLLDGRLGGMFDATQLFQHPGITLKLRRQPVFRSPGLTPSVNKLDNATMTRDSNVDGTPDSWTSLGGTLTIASATDSLHVVAASAGQGVYQSTGAASAAPGQSWTASVDVKVASGSVQLVANWRTSGDADISSVTASPVGTGWQRISASGVAPATTDRVRVRLESVGGAATFDVKNAQAEQASSQTLFRSKAQTVVLDPATTTAFLNTIPVFNPGTAPCPVAVRATFPDASNQTTTLLVGLRTSEDIPGRYRIADWLNTTSRAQLEASANGWTIALGTDTSAVAGSGASGSGSNVARVTHSTTNLTMTKRVSIERTTLLDSLRGDFDVYVRVLAGGARRFRLQLKWAYGDVSPLPNVNDEYVHDVVDAPAFNWVMVPLGRISIPTETDSALLGKLKMEIWTAQKANSAQNLDLDYLRLVPANSAWILTPATDRTVWEASALTTPVTNPASGTAATIGPNTGLAYFDDLTDNVGSPAITAVGHHSTRFNLGAENYGGTDRTVKINIRNTTDSTDVVSRTVTLKPGVDTKVRTLEWDAASGKSYQAQVDDPSAVGGGGKYVYLRRIIDTFTPVFDQNSSMQTDPGSRPTRRVNEKLDSSGNSVMVLDGTGVPFWIPPGLSAIYVESWDTIGRNYTEPTHNLARTMTVQATPYPRWWM